MPPLTGTLAVLSKACETDPDGGGELLRLTLFEALADLTEAYGPSLERDFAKALQGSTDLTRRHLVRSFVSKRLAGDDVSDIIAAAGAAALVSKAYNPNEKRNRLGEWTKEGGPGLDKVAAFVNGDDKSKPSLEGVAGEQPGRGYRQLAAGGQALKYASLATGNGTGAALGMTVQFAGELGPQAENVLGPSLKRVAYRYRGTERRVPNSLVVPTDMLADLLTTPDAKLTARQKMVKASWIDHARSAQETSKQPDPEVGIYNYWAKQPVSLDAKRIGATSDYVAMKLHQNIPTVPLAKLSLHAGKMPPSVGVIIDRNGNLVSQAQGYNGDHYLPFDLKNLRSLQGGSYVRTRVTGGPTDEDIYTGLMTGARRITVVSHSGVFTVDFERDVRGLRRYSDKARQMVGRYAAIVAQVGSGSEMQRPFTTEERASMLDEAQRLAGRHASRSEVEAQLWTIRQRKIDDLVLRGNVDAGLKGREDARTNAARTIAAGGQISNQQLARDEREMDAQAKSQAASVYRLDGEGYSAALQALKSEFPFYIAAVDFKPWPQFAAPRGILTPITYGGEGERAADIGYTEHKGLAPAKAGGKKTEKTAAVEAPKPVAGGFAADAAEPQPASVEINIRDTPVGQSLERTLRGSVKALDELDSPAPPLEVKTLDDASTESPGIFGRYVANQPSGDVAKWLLDDATPDQIAKVKSSFEILKHQIGRLGAEDRRALSMQYPDIDKAIDSLDAIAVLRDPYAKADGDPVLTAGAKAQRFADTALGTSKVAYVDYLERNEDVNREYQTIRDRSDEEIADIVNVQVSEYRNLYSWGQHIAEDPDAVSEPERNLHKDQADDAREIYANGPNTQQYRDLENLQKAWSIKRGLEIAAIARGLGTDAGPKDLSKKLGTSSRVVLHPPGSPIAVALSKRLASRLAKPPRGRLVAK